MKKEALRKRKLQFLKNVFAFEVIHFITYQNEA